MRIHYLGTAAAEGIPAIFCDCETCRRSAELGGRNIRTRSQALIDDRLLVDFPADTYMHFLQYRIPMTKIKHCLITHSHMDHLYPEDLYMRKDGFAHLQESGPLTLYADASGFAMIRDVKLAHSVPDDTLQVVPVKLNEPFDVDGYTVTALRAAHDPNSTPVVYLIERDGKSVFYSNDTSEYPEESMAYLKTLKKPVDLLSLDCTEACNDATYIGHLSLDRCISLREVLRSMGVVDDHTVCVLNHFSHNGKHVIYDDFVKIAAEHGFEVTYDGMVIEI